MSRDYNEYGHSNERDLRGSLSHYEEQFGFNEMDKEFEAALKRERTRIQASKRGASLSTPSTSLDQNYIRPSKLGDDAIRLRFEIISRKRIRAPSLNTPTHHLLTGNIISPEHLLTPSDLEFLQTYPAPPPGFIVDFKKAEQELAWFFGDEALVVYPEQDNGMSGLTGRKITAEDLGSVVSDGESSKTDYYSARPGSGS